MGKTSIKNKLKNDKGNNNVTLLSQIIISGAYNCELGKVIRCLYTTFGKIDKFGLSLANKHFNFGSAHVDTSVYICTFKVELLTFQLWLILSVCLCIMPKTFREA